MSMTISKNTNPHITALENVFDQATKPVEWLVIAHSDAQMLDALSSAMCTESAAVLEVPQDTCQIDDKLTETIEWALQQHGIRNLVLVANSRFVVTDCQASLVSPPQHTPGEIEKLVAGRDRFNTQSQETQKRFGSLVQQLSEIREVQQRCDQNELAIYGLFYRSETGVFLAYDANQDAFRPLVSN